MEYELAYGWRHAWIENEEFYPNYVTDFFDSNAYSYLLDTPESAIFISNRSRRPFNYFDYYVRRTGP